VAEKKTLKQAENLLESTRDLSQLMMQNVEKLVKMNLELVESYSHIGLESYKAALGIRSIDELKEYAKKATRSNTGNCWNDIARQQRHR